MIHGYRINVRFAALRIVIFQCLKPLPSSLYAESSFLPVARVYSIVVYSICNAVLFRLFYSRYGPADLWCWFPNSHKLGRIYALHGYLCEYRQSTCTITGTSSCLVGHTYTAYTQSTPPRLSRVIHTMCLPHLAILPTRIFELTRRTPM